MNNNQQDKDVIDIGKIIALLYSKKRKFIKLWIIVFALAALWIFPKPRYYTCEVALAPETSGDDVAGGLAGIASSFGINIGSTGSDAIYPLLYPELMESNNFIVSLLNINVTTEDGTVSTDYFTYLKKHQKQNWLTKPFKDATKAVAKLFIKEPEGKPLSAAQLDAFRLSKKDFELVESVKEKITCSVDKKTEVITINVQDQDPLVCATLADSVSQRLQAFIINYRTHKTRIDVLHYQSLADSALAEYNNAIRKYSIYCDANQDILLQTEISERDKLESEMQLKYNTYTAMNTQLEMMKAKLQERTPAFTILKAPSVPIKPAGPKRVIFIITMLILASAAAAIWMARKELHIKF